MKTTIDIADPLFRKAKKVATERGTTFKDIVETALRRFLGDEKRPGGAFKLRDASVIGRGVQPGVEEGEWAELRRLIYEGRGA